jgi:hypothetical protein
MNRLWLEWKIPDEVKEILNVCSHVVMPKNRQEIFSLAVDGDNDFFEIAYEIEDRGRFVEAEVVRCKNGMAINFTEKYMRRRDT